MPVEELLVHISAGGHAREDERWRQLAANYEDFEVAQRTDLSNGFSRESAEGTQYPQDSLGANTSRGSSPSSPGTPVAMSLISPEPTNEQPHNLAWDSAVGSDHLLSQAISFISDPGEAAAAIESQLETSSLRDMQTSSPLYKRQNPAVPSPGPASLQQTRSTVKSVRFKSPGSGRVLERKTDSSLANEAEYPSPSAKALDRKRPRMPKAPVLKKRRTSPKMTPGWAKGRGGILPSPAEADQSGVESTVSSASAAPREERLDQVDDSPSSMLRSSHPDDSSPEPGPSMIIPPEPPIADLPVEERTIVPRALAALFNTPKISAGLVPRIKPLRVLNPRERGCWAISMKSWDARKKAETWMRLEQAIGKGRAGYEVTVFREIAALGAEYGGKPDEFDLLRVYCYGEIAVHVFVWLYGESFGLCARDDPVWMDGKGEAAVVVEPVQL